GELFSPAGRGVARSALPRHVHHRSRTMLFDGRSSSRSRQPDSSRADRPGPGSSHRPARRLWLEPLEDRTLLAGSLFPDVASNLAGPLNSFDSKLGSLLNQSVVELPVVGAPLKDIAAARTAITAFRNKLIAALNSIPSNAETADVQKLLFQALGSKLVGELD